jgi:SNF2 family DNA or RNA helicase
VEGVKFMFDCVMGKKEGSITGCILADFMGLGKTLQTLTLLFSLLKIKKKSPNKIKKGIVVCPLTLVANWEA